MVLGHTHCSAIDGAVDRWLEKKASAWPWPSSAPQQGNAEPVYRRGSLRADFTMSQPLSTHCHAMDFQWTTGFSEGLWHALKTAANETPLDIHNAVKWLLSVRLTRQAAWHISGVWELQV